MPSSELLSNRGLRGSAMLIAFFAAGALNIALSDDDTPVRRPFPKDRPGLKPGEITKPPALEERRPEVLKAGDDAPDFELKTRSGEASIRLSSFSGQKPVVLVFGSLTCPPFRSRVPELEQMYARYKDRAEFFLVYLREAHPGSTVTVVQDGVESLEVLLQTDDWEERATYAEKCTTTLGLTFPALIDNLDNQVRDAYAGWPSRLVVVGIDGKIAFDGGRGPRGFQPAKLNEWLQRHLPETSPVPATEQAEAAAPTAPTADD